MKDNSQRRAKNNSVWIYVGRTSPSSGGQWIPLADIRLHTPLSKTTQRAFLPLTLYGFTQRQIPDTSTQDTMLPIVQGLDTQLRASYKSLILKPCNQSHVSHLVDVLPTPIHMSTRCIPCNMGCDSPPHFH